jgi:hypothetical protein
LVRSILSYSRSIWKFRCSLLHGRTIDKTRQQKILQLQHHIKQAYEEYSGNPFNVHHGARRLFIVPLDDRLQHDEDGLRFSLRTYELARNRQKLDIELQTNAIAHFFLPKSLPTVITLSEDSDISICTNYSTCSNDETASCSVSGSSLRSVRIQQTSSGSTSAVSYSSSGDYSENDITSGLSGFQGPSIDNAA